MMVRTLLLCLPLTSVAASLQLRVVETIAYPGAISTLARDINNSGQVVGYYIDAGYNQHAFLKSGSTYTSLDGLTNASAINDLGQIVGEGTTGPVLYDKGVLQNVDLGAGARSVTVADINNHGDVAGYYDRGTGEAFVGFVLTNDGILTSFKHPDSFAITSIGAIMTAEWPQVVISRQLAFPSRALAS